MLSTSKRKFVITKQILNRLSSSYIFSAILYDYHTLQDLIINYCELVQNRMYGKTPVFVLIKFNFNPNTYKIDLIYYIINIQVKKIKLIQFLSKYIL